MLGHLRHEVGHYYQNVLLTDDASWDRCRELFGDERASYQDAIKRHYAFGAPEGWHESFISEYATMHPWEDFAETWAHYLHITGTLQTAAAIGIRLDATVTNLRDTDVVPLESYEDRADPAAARRTGSGCRRGSTASTARWDSATSTRSRSSRPCARSSRSCTRS